MADEVVRIDVLVDAIAAIKQLQQIHKNTEGLEEEIVRLGDFFVKFSQRTNVPLKQVQKLFRDINAEMVQMGRGPMLGSQTNDLLTLAEKYNQVRQSAGAFRVNQDGVATSLRGGEKAAQAFGHGIDLVRTALGTLAAVGIFQLLSAISGVFKELLHNVRETELAVYNLINAERRLSQEGITVTPKGLQETIDAVRELVPILSQIQAEELVSRIATNVAPALKLTNEQIRQMAEATALLYVRNKALGKSFDEVEAQLTNAFLTGKVSQGINNLGVKLSDQIVKDEAMRLGLVKTEEQFNSLTGEMEAQIKAAAMLSVVYKNATQDVQSIGDYMETADAQIERSKTAWDNLLTVIGSEFGPALAKIMEMVAHTLEVIIVLLEKTKEPLSNFVATFVAMADTFRGKNFLTPSELFGLLTDRNFWKEFLQNFGKTKESMKGLAEAADTPTSAIENLADTMDDLDADAFSNKIEDIIEDAKNAREDLEAKLGQKRSDIDLEYQRKALDAQKDYVRKTEDIERDYQRDLAKIREKQREEDLKAEENYQNKLWELRMRYLMDLEDALHARDARQVIRLQKQYEIDKEALARKQGLDDKQRNADQKAELEDARIKRDQRLADAKLEYEQKLSDQRTAKQRELDDLAVWYKRELNDLQTSIRRKLETLIAGWVAEKKITEANAAQVYAILSKYFGPGGMTDQLYQYLASKLAVPLPMPSFGAAGGGGTGPLPYWQLLQNQQNAGRTGSRQMAEGGTLVATRPTSVTFGEAGPEMASFTPLNKLGRDTNKVFSSANSGSGLNGQIILSVSLSPDLEARIVESALDGTAQIITKINRSKL